MKKRIHVVFGTDHGYVQHLGITITSLLLNSRRPEELTIHVLGDGLEEIDETLLAACVESSGATIKHYPVDLNGHVRDAKGRGHISQATYLRLTMSRILPAELNRVIYLDCDLIVEFDIAELWAVDLEGATFAAASDTAALFEIESEKMPVERRSPSIFKQGQLKTCPNYFNSGVMLIELARWRGLRIAERALKLIAARETPFQFVDQDALNLVVLGSQKNLPDCWNWQTYSPEYYRLVNREMPRPKVIHYCGDDKPWHYSGATRYEANYYRYLRTSPWFGYVPADRNFSSAKLRYKKIFSRWLKERAPGVYGLLRRPRFSAPS